MIKMKSIIITVLTVLLLCILYKAVTLNSTPQATENYFIKESVGQPKALLILLPGLGNAPESVFDETELETVGSQNGIITIVPKVQSNIILDDDTYQKIVLSARQALQKYSLSSKNLIVGGFSAGGAMALLVAERANKENAEIKPQAVVAIDPPVDLSHLWTTYTKSLQRSPSSPSAQEAVALTKYMQDITGGTPSEQKDKYSYYSSYTASMTNGGNAQYLVKTFVRIYCEPDTVWYKINRGYDYQDLNASCSIAMIKQLQSIGNDHAQVVITSNKGYRRDGKRHPHSWSILDANDCVNWLRQIHILQ